MKSLEAYGPSKVSNKTDWGPISAGSPGLQFQMSLWSSDPPLCCLMPGGPGEEGELSGWECGHWSPLPGFQSQLHAFLAV